MVTTWTSSLKFPLESSSRVSVRGNRPPWPRRDGGTLEEAVTDCFIRPTSSAITQDHGDHIQSSGFSYSNPPDRVTSLHSAGTGSSTPTGPPQDQKPPPSPEACWPDPAERGQVQIARGSFDGAFFLPDISPEAPAITPPTQFRGHHPDQSSVDTMLNFSELGMVSPELHDAWCVSIRVLWGSILRAFFIDRAGKIATPERNSAGKHFSPSSAYFSPFLSPTNWRARKLLGKVNFHLAFTIGTMF